MSRFGGEQTPEEHAHIGTLDVNCGFAAGIAMGISLYHKLRTGEVTRARTSLATVTNLAQIPFAFDYPGRPEFNQPSGREALGNHALSHFYQCAQDWIFLDASRAELATLSQVQGLRGIDKAADLSCFLQHAFLTETAAVLGRKITKRRDSGGPAKIYCGIARSIHTARRRQSRFVQRQLCVFSLPQPSQRTLRDADRPLRDQTH